MSFIELHWYRLQIPRLLGTFWMVKVGFLFLTAVVDILKQHLLMGNFSDDIINPSSGIQRISLDILNASQHVVLVNGSDNFVSLCGMTAVVSVLCRFIVHLMAVIVGVPNENDWTYSQVPAILFLLLALQTGITGLPPPRRIERMYRNFGLLSMAILHFVHSMCKQVLLQLSAGQQHNWYRHLRALGMCLFLLACPAVFLIILWQTHPVNAWMLAVTAFGSEVMVKVCFTLLQYVLFMVDAKSEEVWVELDDYIYYIKATGSCIEFVFGLFLFFNGVWIFFNESGGAIRAIMLCIHTYFNIWVQAREGWNTFTKRRLAASRIGWLPDMAADHLSSVGDVCAICFTDHASSTKRTPCGHIYHAVCLRKWLYVKGNCPMCHAPVFSAAQQQMTDPTENNPNPWPEAQLNHED